MSLDIWQDMGVGWLCMQLLGFVILFSCIHATLSKASFGVAVCYIEFLVDIQLFPPAIVDLVMWESVYSFVKCNLDLIIFLFCSSKYLWISASDCRLIGVSAFKKLLASRV